MNRLKLMFFFFFLITGTVAGAEKEELTIFYASTLASPIKDITNEFQKKYPDVFISGEASGSREAVRKVAELKRNADILITADPLVIRDILMPEYADWYINFAATRMVICFTEQSKYGNEINRDNWYRVLSRPGVQIGRVNQDNSPLGYRTLMTWQLADRYYKPEGTGKTIYDSLSENCPPGNIRPDELELLPLLQNFTLDYIFEYQSVAKQHNLKYILLPKEIDLSDPLLDSVYKEASVVLTGKRKGEVVSVHGSSITYSVTIPTGALHKPIAIKFLRFLFDSYGRDIFNKNFIEFIVPVYPSDSTKIPEELRTVCRQ